MFYTESTLVKLIQGGTRTSKRYTRDTNKNQRFQNHANVKKNIMTF